MSRATNTDDDYQAPFERRGGGGETIIIMIILELGGRAEE